MRGSLFPLFSRPIFSSCQDMDHQNMGNRDPLSVFVGEVPKPWERPYFPISPKGEMPKPWEGPYFPYFPYFGGQMPKPWEGPYFPYFHYFQSLSFHLAKTWTTKKGEIGEIGTLSWFWHFALRGNRGNRDPVSVFPWWSAKAMKGPLFPLFWWPMSWQDDKAWTTKIGEIGEIGTLSWFWHFTLRGNKGNRDPVSVFPWWSAKTRVPISPILVAHVLTRWQGVDHQNRGNRDPLMVLALHP